MKKIIWSLLILLGIAVAVSGCARWPDGPGPGPGEPEYQLEITLEVKGEINTDDGIYYIALDTDGKPATGPTEDISLWEGTFYYVKLNNMGCWLHPKEEGSEEIQLNNYSIFDNRSKLQVTIALSDLGNPESCIEINVVTTDSVGYTTYDYLDSYFSITTEFNQTGEGTSSKDLEDDKADFDIVKVTALITTQ